MIPAVPMYNMDYLFGWRLAAVIAPIDMEAGAIEVGKGGDKRQPLTRCGGNEAMEGCDPIGMTIPEARLSVPSLRCLASIQAGAKSGHIDLSWKNCGTR
jgi:hypothetical protein